MLLHLLISKSNLQRNTRIPHAQGPITTIAETQEEEEGPFELPPSSTSTSIFATNDDPTPLQTATSVLLTGAIGVFLFRSLRRRAKRAKELRLRSSDTKKSLKEEALDNLKAISSASIDTKSSTPSAVQALLGSIVAGSTNNNNYQDYCEWIVLPCHICFRHQFSRLIPLFRSACLKFLHGWLL
ncbi:hypothetical protein GOBAR_DD34648 [Gossypium barbadense]|nr:hypothetical protein GOBAR_DD34648 [Gossypium barbadense]